jgi:hypothetical protein
VSYTGTQTRYATLANALAETNPTGGPFTVPNRITAPPYDTPFRDVGFYFIKDGLIPYASPDYNILLTAYYYSTSGAPFSGTGNPNNTNAGFVQLYDDDASTDTSYIGFFENNKTSFTLVVKGANATGPLDFARLWNAAGEPNTGGTFHTYEIEITFHGLNGALNLSNGLYEASNHPTGVSGTFRGVFENTSAANSFYSVNWTFGMDNWAFGQGGSLVEGGITESFFASNLAVPEPGTLGLLSAAVGLFAFRRRRVG